jgi:hypothetical protein
LLVPFAACSAAACAETLRAIQLPQLQKLLRRLGSESQDLGQPEDLSMPHERALARAHGLQAQDGLVPLAALQVAQSGQGDATQGWAWITPSHWRVGRDHIAMAAPAELQLDERDSLGLLAAMRPYFEEDRITLAYDTATRWLACGDIFRSLPSASLDRVSGRTVESWLPRGDAGKSLRRLQQEMQMLLYTLPLNDARQQQGLLPVNSFWISGTGALPMAQAAQPAGTLQVAESLRDAALQGDWNGWAAAWQQLDSQECARLLEQLERGAPVRLTLCGETGARTWSSAAASAWQRLRHTLAPAAPLKILEAL